MSEVILESVLTCPQCGHAKREVMPTDACQFFYQCESCQVLLRPRAGDCCVFCTFGAVKCPPMQLRASCTCRGQGEGQRLDGDSVGGGAVAIAPAANSP